jgi:CDP-diacylglycerol--glycerol-3-phosphate 3-phosphatidyltransferase
VTDGAVISEKSEPAPIGRRVGPAPLVNAANALTAARMVLVPVFVLLTVASGLTHPGLRMAATVAFFVAAVTDLVDGWIARTWDLVTSFGKVADPIAVTALRFWVIRHGVIAASRGGKIKTALQTLAIVWYLWPFGPTLAQAGPWLMGAALIVTVVTGVDYVARALRLRRDSALARSRGGHEGPRSGVPGPDRPGPDRPGRDEPRRDR